MMCCYNRKRTKGQTTQGNVSRGVVIQVLDQNPSFLEWRTHNFLSDPRTPRSLTWSQSSIWFNFPRSEAPTVYATGAQTYQETAARLQAVTADMDARVLRIQNLQPGFFESFDTDTENVEFNTWFTRMMFDLKWCCSTNVQELREKMLNAVFFKGPAPLPATLAAGYKVSGHQL